MKSNYILLLIVTFFTCNVSAQVGIGTTSPDVSSVLDVTSSDKGILIPRMTAIERLSIAPPIGDGLLVYQVDDIEGFYFYDGTSWDRILKQTKDAVPIGAIFTFPVETPPTGYLVCDGSAVSRTTYSALFAIIGTMYGNGNGTTTFNLPDYRGKFLRGLDSGSGTDPDASNRLDRGDGTTGDAVGTLQGDAMSGHNHEIDAPSTPSSDNGDHYHSTYTPPTISSYTGEHNHSNPTLPIVIGGGSHNHVIRYETLKVATSSFGQDRRLLSPNSPPQGAATVTDINTHHTHNFNLPSTYTSTTGEHAHNITIPVGSTNLSSSHNHDVDIPNFNSSSVGTAENRPINITVVWCIKY